jgi:hypothetical protein
MTASDVLIKTTLAHRLLDKTEITEDELRDLHNTLGKYDDTLQRLWFMMIDLDNTISDLKRKKDKDALDEGFIKVLSNVRDQMAAKFGEKGYFTK